MRGAPRTRARVTAVLTATVLLLAGCVGIPTSGDIGQGDVDVADPGPGIPLAADDPTVDAPRETIVNEFLRAGAAGLYDDFTTARKFLTVAASSDWDPRAGILVYDGGEPTVTVRQDGTAVVSVRVAAMVDAGGRYTERVPGAAPHELSFELVQDAGNQWRISRLDDGVLMNVPNFTSQFRRTEIYFASQDLRHLVPETRWFAVRRFESAAVAALVEGPSPWLRDAIRTGAPVGSRLRNDAVTVVDGVAVVELSADLNLAEEGDRELFQAQLEATLVQTTGRVRAVEVTVGGLPWEPRRADVPSLVRDAAPESGPYVVTRVDDADRLAVVERGEARPLEDAAPLTGIDAQRPALSPDLATRVVLDGTRRLLLVPADGAPLVPLAEGASLLAPSVDRFGWVWTGERRSSGTLRALAADGREVEMPVDWLTGQEVRSVRVARDGARIAVAYSALGESDVAVEVAGLVRDADGVPTAVTAERLGVGAPLDAVVDLVWADQSTLAVLGLDETSTDVSVHRVPLGGETESLPLLDGARTLAAGRADRILVEVAPGVVYAWQNRSWVVVVEGVRGPVFPG